MAALSDSESSSSDGLVSVAPVFLVPYCHCSHQAKRDLENLIWTPGEEFGRCFECANRVDSHRLSPTLRLKYLVMLALWRLLDYEAPGPAPPATAPAPKATAAAPKATTARKAPPPKPGARPPVDPERLARATEAGRQGGQQMRGEIHMVPQTPPLQGSRNRYYVVLDGVEGQQAIFKRWWGTVDRQGISLPGAAGVVMTEGELDPAAVFHGFALLAEANAYIQGADLKPSDLIRQWGYKAPEQQQRDAH